MADLANIVESLRNRRPYRLRVILLCTAAAMTFWFLNALNKQHTTTMNYPVQFLYDEQKYVEVENLPSEILINVSGIGWNLLKNSMGIKITPLQIPLVNPQDQKKIAASALPSYISEQLSDFQLNYVLTDTLRINLDRRAEKYIHLSLDTTSLVFGERYIMASPLRISPDSILIRGPLQLVSNVADTVLLDLGPAEITDDVIQQVQIPISVERIAVDIREASVSFDVLELVENRSLVPVVLTGVTDTTYSIIPNELMVYYLVPPGMTVDDEEFVVEAELSTLDEDSTLAPVIVSSPSGISEIYTDSVRVQLVRK